MRYLAHCDYVGTDFIGWQSQLKGTSVQGVLNDSLKMILRTEPGVTGCGRTDAGVHGCNYGFHFDASENIDLNQLKYRLNGVLPNSVAVNSIIPVADDFHARFSAKSRSYIYRIHTEKNPFATQFSWYYAKLSRGNIDLIREFLEALKNVKNFGSLSKTGSDNKTTLVHVQNANWILNGSSHEFHIEADRFLRGMVRLITGTTVNIALGKMTVSETIDLIRREEKLPIAYAAPARGLTFTGVKYIH